MQPREEVPEYSVPRFTVTQLTEEKHVENSNGPLVKKFRTFYIVDLHDRARVVLKVRGGSYSPLRWSSANNRAHRFAEKMNDAFEQGLKDSDVRV